MLDANTGSHTREGKDFIGKEVEKDKFSESNNGKAKEQSNSN